MLFPSQSRNLEAGARPPVHTLPGTPPPSPFFVPCVAPAPCSLRDHVTILICHKRSLLPRRVARILSATTLILRTSFPTFQFLPSRRSHGSPGIRHGRLRSERVVCHGSTIVLHITLLLLWTDFGRRRVFPFLYLVSPFPFSYYLCLVPSPSNCTRTSLRRSKDGLLPKKRH